MIESICEKIVDEELKTKIRTLIDMFRDHSK